MSRKTENSFKTDSMQPLPPPQIAPPSPPPSVINSVLPTLRYDVRKFPGDYQTISIYAGEIINPRTTVVSYDFLLAAIRKTWPVDNEKQQLLMNWTFPIIDQESFVRCVIQLCSYGRNRHDIVLCDLFDGKLPEDALKIQAELQKGDGSFWQGRWDPAQVQSRLEFLNVKAHDGRRGVVAGVTAEKRYPWGAGKWRNTAGAQLYVRPKSPRRQPPPPESQVSAGASGGRQVSSSVGAYQVDSRHIVSSLLSQPTPVRWRQGGGVTSEAIGAWTSEKTLVREPLPVVNEDLGNSVPADTQFGSESVAADSHRQQLESGVMPKIGGTREIPAEQIRLSDDDSSDLSMVSAEGSSSQFRSTVVPSQRRFKYPSMKVAGQGTPEKRYPIWDVEKWCTTAGKHHRYKPNSTKRQTSPPESVPPPKRRDSGPVSAIATVSSGSYHVSRTGGADRVASKLNVQTITSQPTAGRWGGGGGVASGAESAATTKTKLAREPLLGTTEIPQNPGPADAQVGSEPDAAGAHGHEEGRGVLQKVFQFQRFPEFPTAADIEVFAQEPLASESPMAGQLGASELLEMQRAVEEVEEVRAPSYQLGVTESVLEWLGRIN